jgi:hypothetical protein
MTISSWVRWVRASQRLGQADHEGLRALSDCELFFVHIDELAEVTVGYTGSISAEEAAYFGADPSHNALEFFLKFQDVSGLLVDGWTVLSRRTLSIGRNPDDRLQVTIRADGTDIVFACAAATVVKARTHPAGEA